MRVWSRIPGLLFLAVGIACITAASIQPRTAAPKHRKITFADVLPILSDNCYKCHGPDSAARMANLRLDDPSVAFASRHGQWAIVPGHPESSLLVQRIFSATSPMPPVSSGKSLSADEKEMLKQWIIDGAPYGKLWSFEPVPKVVPLPSIKSSWPSNDIDRFILARLKQQGLSPSGPASRERILRRVTLDLTGLPPTEAEISAFLNDKSPNAYEKVVDRLLASPHYGERIATDWLDAARYADSYGYQSDLIMPAWPYRDWVVKAFNENMPYDRFLIDQIAGDLLPNATRDERLATCFNRLHRQSNEGGSIPLEFKTEYAVDRTDTFGTAVLGLTVGCARCHDHKFDPMTQKEYYQLLAYFDSINEFGLLLSTEIVPTPSLLLPTPEQETTLNRLRTANAAAIAGVGSAADNAGPGFEEWVKSGDTKVRQIPGLLAHITFDKEDSGKFADAAGGKVFAEALQKVDVVDGDQGKGVLFDGDNGIAVRGLPAKERWDAFTWSFRIQDERSSTVPQVLLHRTGGTDVGFCGLDLMIENGFLTARVMRAWPGNAVAIRTLEQVPKGQWTTVAWSYDGSSRAVGLKLYLDGKQAATTVLNDKLWKKINAYGDLGDSHGDWAFGQRFRDAGFKGGKVGDVYYADRALSDIEVAQLCDHHSLLDALKDPEANRTALRDYYLAAFDPEASKARETLKTAQMNLANFEEGIYEVPVMEEAKTEEPTYLLERGRYDAPRNEKTLVHRGVPAFLPPLHASGKNDRLALAKWATRSDNPLTPRVAVNRLWQMVFGTGLVETSEDFGIQGARPTHPELLDYLARQFVDSGWNVKAMLKELVLSSTYRQDSATSQKLEEIDPENKLLARGPSGRLTAEMIRDTALAASGLLYKRIGGPPVNPYQPAGIWTENNDMSPPFVQSTGLDLYRRSLYTTIKRTTPMPSLLLFDGTSREACSVRRQTTDTPLQALDLLNDVQYVEAARVLADRVLCVNESDPERIRKLFLRLAGREPDSVELDILLQTLKEQREQFAADPDSAKRLVAIGDSKATPTLSPVELGAMTVVVQTVFNSDAVIWKR